jgi:hypothetical protein
LGKGRRRRVLSLAEHTRSKRGMQDTSLPKREAATSRRREGIPTLAKCAPAERVYVPVEEESPRRREAAQRETESSVAREKTSGPAMREVFGPGGLLERCMIGGYEHRAAQLEMAELVHDAFTSKHHAVVEAGTGTGKTLAYLLPAICSGRRVVISTATKSLQEQLYQKDIPFLQKHFAPELKVAVMKGRSNFLCRVKAHQMVDQPMLKGLEEIDAFRQIREWTNLTETGDRAELTFLPTIPICGRGWTRDGTPAPVRNVRSSISVSLPRCTSERKTLT